VLLDDGQRKYIAKFSANNDLYNVVKAEFIAMRLARKAGLNVAGVDLRTAMGKDILVIESFDRVTQMIMRVTTLRFGTEISCP
jgi:serine/threonine-protein kinase HipA